MPVSETPPALGAEQQIERGDGLWITWIEIRVSISKLAHIAFKQDHRRQTRRTFTARHAGAQRIVADRQRDQCRHRLAGGITGGDGQGGGAISEVVHAVGVDADRERGVRAPEDQTFGERHIVRSEQGHGQHAVLLLDQWYADGLRLTGDGVDGEGSQFDAALAHQDQTASANAARNQQAQRSAGRGDLIDSSQDAATSEHG